MQGTNAALASSFVAGVFGPQPTEGHVYLSSLPNTPEDRDRGEPGEKHVMTRDMETVARFVERWDRPRRGLFWCVSTLRPDAPRRAKENVWQLPALHADIDFKSIEATRGEVLDAIEVLPCQPSVIVASGNGLHLYWRLKEAVELDAEGVARIEMALRQLADVVGGDIGVAEVSRLMRLPGTHNTKGGAEKLVEVIRSNERVFLLEDIEEMLSYVSPLIRRKTPSPARGIRVAETNPFLAAAARLGHRPAVDVQSRLEAMSYQGAGNACVHQTQISVSASLLSRGEPIELVISTVLEATRAAAGEFGERWNWVREERSVRRMCEDWLRKNPPPPIKVEHVAAMRSQRAGPPKSVEDQSHKGDSLAPGGRVFALADFRPEADDARDPRPLITIEQGNLEEVVDEAEAALIASGRGLYQRANAIVGIGEAKRVTASEHEVAVQQIYERGESALFEDLVCAALFQKFDKRSKSMVLCDPPKIVVKVLRERTGRLRFPPLAGVVNAPTLRFDGSVLDVPGYDAATGLLFEPRSAVFSAVPASPSREDALAALAALSDLVSTFPFVGPSDRSICLSAILTASVRRSLRAAPLHGFSAPVAGSGKSTLADIAAIVATGREAPVIAQGANEEELEKRLASLFLAGDQFVSIDNCERPLGGEFLCQVLTQPMVRTRILGRSETPEMPTSVFMAATGNNLVLAGDMARRALVCNLDPRVECPEERQFDVDPLAAAKAQRPALVVAALTVLHAYVVAGSPSRAPRLGSFGEWSDLVRSALLWLGEADPVSGMAEARRKNPVVEKKIAVFTQWAAVIGDEMTTAAEAIRRATEKISNSFTQAAGDAAPPVFAHPVFRDALMDVAGKGGNIDATFLGSYLRKNRDTVFSIDGRLWRFERGENDPKKGSATWNLFPEHKEPVF